MNIAICIIPEETFMQQGTTKWPKPAEYQKFINKLI
jgi:hypothetical protein